MRIGIVPNLNRDAGGVYQYAATMLEALCDLGTGDEFVVFTYGGESLPEGMRAPGEVVPLRRAGAGPLRLAVATVGGALRPGSVIDPAWRSLFGRHGVDLLIFTADNDLAPRTGVPYMVAIHDIQHRLHPEFPEVSADGEWERREARLRPLIEHATVVLVDSEVGREDIINHYGDTGIAPGAVRPLPFLPAHYLLRDIGEDARRAVVDKYGLPRGGYLFYPAQFWPHKNHVRLVKALGILAEQGLRIPLALVGSHEGVLRERTFAEVTLAAETAGVSDLVHYLGYVPDDDMSALYAEALALAMPTFFGPTNIPALEAFQLGCPVITSGIRGIREHVEDAAILVDPESVDSIAEGIREVATSEARRTDLIETGHRWIEQYPRQRYVELLAEAIGEAKLRVTGGGA